MNDERQLLIMAKQNHAQSLEKLVIRYKSLVCQIARGYFLVSGGDSDDLIQEGTIGLLKAIASFDADRGKNFSAFASLCIKNNIKDALRKAASDKNKALNLANCDQNSFETVQEYTPDPLSEYIDKEESQTLFDTLKTLLKDDQITVLKLYLDGYSYGEMAKMLDKTTKYVDNTLNSAKNKIKKYYNDKDGLE